MYKYLLVLAAAFTLNAQEGPKGPPPGPRGPKHDGPPPKDGERPHKPKKN